MSGYNPNTIYGKPIPEETKVCRDCGREKPISAFEINRKFYRADLPEKHYVIRRPACKKCRATKKPINPEQKKLFQRPDTLICPICGDLVKGSYARLDHSHETGDVRGWICDNCNTGLGKLKESVAVLRRAINWIEK